MRQLLLLIITAAIFFGCAKNALLDFSAAVIPPKNVRASDGTLMNKIRVTWDKAEGATSYQVFRSATASGGFTNIATTTTNEYDDTTSFADITYYYGVRSVGAGGASTLSTIDSGSGAVDTRTFSPAGYYGGTAASTASGQFDTPTGIATDGTYVYVREMGNNQRIQRLTLAGVAGGSIGGTTSAWSNPSGGCYTTAVFCFIFWSGNGLVYGNGYLYAADTGSSAPASNNRIQRIIPGTTSASFAGRLGGGVDAWHMVSDLPVQNSTNEYLPRYYATGTALFFGISLEGYLIVADSHKNRVSIIDQSGALIRTFGATGTDDYAFGSGNGGGSLAGPRSVAVDSAGNIYFADPINRRIAKYSIKGELIGLRYSGHDGWKKGLSPLASETSGGDFPSTTTFPSGIGPIAIDAKGYLYVAVLATASTYAVIQQFSPAGRYLQSFGTTGGAEDGQLSATAQSGGMVFDPNDNILYVTNNHKVQKFSR